MLQCCSFDPARVLHVGEVGGIGNLCKDTLLWMLSRTLELQMGMNETTFEMVKHSCGGTSLYKHWYPDVGEFWPGLKQTIRDRRTMGVVTTTGKESFGIRVVKKFGVRKSLAKTDH